MLLLNRKEKGIKLRKTMKGNREDEVEGIEGG